MPTDMVKLNRADKIISKQFPGLSKNNHNEFVKSIYCNMTKSMSDKLKYDREAYIKKSAEITLSHPMLIKSDRKELLSDNFWLLSWHIENLQKAAYKLQGKASFQGLPISIENKAGSVRKGKDPNGHEWQTKMENDYGYIRLTEGADGEHVDCYIGPDKECEKVFVIHQVDPYSKDRKYDEDKVMLGFDNAYDAKEAYQKHYDRPDFFGQMSEWKIENFKEKVHKNKGKINGGKLVRIKKSETMYDIGLDFDGVINSYKSGWKDYDNILDPPVEGTREALNELIADGKSLVIYSARADNPKGKQAIVDYLKKYDLPNIPVADKKPIASIYVDDKGYQFEGNWKKCLTKIKSFKTWLEKSSVNSCLEQLIKKNYSAEELKGMNMRWVTIRGNHVLVQGLDDGSYVVVGGAGGKLNHFKIESLLSPEEYKKKAAEKKEMKLKEMTPETIAEEARKRRESAQGKREARKLYESSIKDILGLQDGDLRAQITQDELDAIGAEAKKKVAKKKKKEEVTKEDAEEIEKTEEELLKKKEEEKLKSAEKQALNILAGEFFGDSLNPDNKSVLKAMIDSDKAIDILKARKEFKKQVTEINKGKEKPSEFKVGSTFAANKDDLDKNSIIDEVQKHVETQMNIQLYDNLNAQSSNTQKHIDEGSLGTLNGIVGDLFDAKALFSHKTVESLGLEPLVKMIAAKMHKEGRSEVAKQALLEFSRRNNMKIVKGALDESDRRFKYADDIRGMAETEGDSEAILSRASANGYALRQILRGQQVLGTAAGSLRAISHLTNALDEPPADKILVDMGTDLSRARKKATKAGLSRDDYQMRTKGKTFIMEISSDRADKFFENNESMRNEESKVDRIKMHKENDGYKPPGIKDSIKFDAAQEAGLKFFKEQGKVLLDYTAGLGKTAVGYGAAMEAINNMGVKKVLVVTPAKLRSQFYQERKVFLDKDNQTKVNLNDKGPEDRKAGYQKNGITIVGHEQLRTDWESIKKAGYGAIIIDEVHELTNPESTGKADSGRYRGMMQLKDIPYKIAMSGTNIKNSKKELYKKINFIDPDHTLGTMKDFESRYKGLNQGSNAFQDSANDAFRKEIAPWSYSQSYTLPVKNNASEITVKLTPEQKTLYKKSEDRYTKERGEGKVGAAARRENRNYDIIHDGMAKSNSKANAIIDQMEANHPGEKAVVHVYRRKALRTATETLEKKYGKGSVVVIHGDTSKKQADDYKKKFNDPGSKVKFLLGTKSLEAGHNLQHGGTVTFHLDVPVSAAARDQRNARTHRKGQTKDTTSYMLRSDTPFDMSKIDNMERKEREMGILGNPRHLEANDDSGFMSILNSMERGEK